MLKSTLTQSSLSFDVIYVIFGGVGTLSAVWSPARGRSTGGTRLTKKPAKASNCAVKSHERVGHFLYAKRCRKTFDASPCYGSLTPPVFLSSGWEGDLSLALEYLYSLVNFAKFKVSRYVPPSEGAWGGTEVRRGAW